MMRICSLVVLVGFCAYMVVGIRIRNRMAKESLHGRLVGFAPFRPDSYTQDGQRHLRSFVRWGIGMPFVILLLAVLGGVVCFVLGERAAPL